MVVIVSVVNHMVDMGHLHHKDMVEIIQAVVDLQTSPQALTTMVHHNLELVFHHNLDHNLLLLKVDLKDLAVDHQVVENATATPKILALLDLLVKKVYPVMMVLMDNLVYLVKMVLMVNILKLNDKNMVNASLAPLVPLDLKGLPAVQELVVCEELEDNLVFLAVMDNLDSQELLDLKAQSDLPVSKDPLVLLVKMLQNSLDYPVLKVNKDLLAQLEILELLVKKDPLDNLDLKENVVHQAKMETMEIMVMLVKLENLVNPVLMLNIVHVLLAALTAKLDQVVKATNMAETKVVMLLDKPAQTIVAVLKLKIIYK
jgi:hypothetical protein